MLHPTAFDAHQHYYPIGNSPAINLAAHLPPEIDVEALLLGCGDVRNILFTLFTESHKEHAPAYRKYHFTCCDREAGLIARNILLLTMIINKEKASDMWSIYYDFLISKKSFVILGNHVEQLLHSAQDMESWSNSDIGKVLNMGSEQTLIAVKRVWRAWADDLRDKNYKLEIMNSYKRWLAKVMDIHSAKGSRPVPNAGTILSEQLCWPYMRHFEKYWEAGTTEASHCPSLTPNPALSSSRMEPFRVDSYSYPPGGYHVSTAIVPFVPEHESGRYFRPIHPTDYAPLVQSVKKEFELWYQALQAAHHSGVFTTCFLVDDVLELCSSLSQLSSGPSSDIIGVQELNKNLIAAK